MPLFDYLLGNKAQEDKSFLGKVIQVDTRRVVVNAEDMHLERASIGRLAALPKGNLDNYLIGMVDRIVRQPMPPDSPELDEQKKEDMQSGNDAALPPSGNVVTVTLVGTVYWDAPESKHRFSRSLTSMPDIGQSCFVIKGDNLRMFMGLLVKEGKTDQALDIGKYALDTTASAFLDGDKFFQRHAALLGSTGAGKSWTVATVLERAARLPSANLIVFDLHGEYRELDYADQLRIPGPDDLGAKADPSLLYLPYWLMNAEELISMFIDRSEFTAHNQTLVFQDTVVEEKRNLLEQADRDEILESFTVDSPVPFELDEVLREIKRLNEEMVQGTRGLKKGDFNGQFSRLLTRMKSKLNDRRYGFLFQAPKALHTYEAFHSLARQLLEFVGERKRIKIIDFSEVPSDVLPVMLGIVARVIYYLQFWMPDHLRHPVALVCDEAHLYLPREKGNPNQQRAVENFEKIAKEGRKYGVALLVVSQRPSDVSTTILSQCNNVMALRLTNVQDISTVKSMMPESLSSFLELLPVLDVGEALAVGDAVLLPSRIKINPPSQTPLSATIDFWSKWSQEGIVPKWELAAENMRRQRRRDA